ncbi:protein artichoke [Battus philenor]|uniref:protein artichoke n=1 Tax=Battus philenor TaxID=42288 RepID=UPI0035D130C2
MLADHHNIVTMTNWQINLVVWSLLCLAKSEYIPPGPAYPCPKTESNLLYPCICDKGTDAGLYIRCENVGLAVLSVGLGNIAGLGFPIERLELKECKIKNLFGSLFHRSTVRVMHIIDTPIKAIDEYAFAGVNRTLQELYMVNTNLATFPKEAFRIMGNLSILHIDGHQMKSLDKDIFGGSEAAGSLLRLHLINGLLSDIPIEAFQNLKKLKTLDLHGNRLANLKRNQFRGMRDLELLDVSYNNITKLDGSHMGDLTKLGWCNASHNLIADIPRGMFARNTVIKVVHLDNNKLKKLDTNSFKGMRFLRRLYLQDNQISDVGRGTFSAVTRIGTVNLARNMIKKVDFQMFQQVKYAEIIDLAENNITLIEKQAFTDLYQAVVNISNNQLSSIEAGAFQNCNNLTVLDLSRNQLAEVTRFAFDENSYASLLDVSYNLFTDFNQIPIHNMSGIRVLNATFNAITEVPKLAFPKLYELHTVDLSHNNISEIGNAVFQNLFSLRYLNLSHNSLERIKPSAFGAVPTVLKLQLEHNELRDISRGALAKLASCREIDVSHNHLDRIFQIPISLGELNIAYNNLTEIKPNTWPSMNALLRLDLTGNQLGDSLRADSFTPLLTLQHLHLTNNGLTTPPWEALNTLSSLQYLYLQYNNITSLSKSAFGNLPTTFMVDLSHNQLSSISPGSFRGLQQLLDLSLRANQLYHIPNEAFKGLVALRKLDLSHNYLEKIDNKTNTLLEDCLSLEMVNLSYNNFGFLSKKMFPSSRWVPYRLREVDLSHNHIPVVTFDITYGTKTVKQLNLSANIINDIRNNVLGNLTSLEVLDLSHNQLKDLISRTSEAKFTLPENISSILVHHNSLETLPVDALLKATKLRLLDVRGNTLTSYTPELVKEVRDRDLQILFDENHLKCDCLLRPLKHHLTRLSRSTLESDERYRGLRCAEPPPLEGQDLEKVDEERLQCAANVGTDELLQRYRDVEDPIYALASEPDLVFRDIQYSQTSIYVHWFVSSAEDIADFVVFVRDRNNSVAFHSEPSYHLRSLTVPVDSELRKALTSGPVELCVQAKSSSGFARKWFDSQCQQIPQDFDSWPRKLTVDKRRLSKKRVYSWFSNNTLGLVSDSILITLCIFLGVCFRRLSDLDI